MKTKKVKHSRETVSSNEKWNYMLTTLSENLLKFEHHADLKNLAEELRKLNTANIALHLVLTKKSELNLKRSRLTPTSLHRRILTSHVFLYCVKGSQHESRLIKLFSRAR